MAQSTQSPAATLPPKLVCHILKLSLEELDIRQSAVRTTSSASIGFGPSRPRSTVRLRWATPFFFFPFCSHRSTAAFPHLPGLIRVSPPSSSTFFGPFWKTAVLKLTPSRRLTPQKVCSSAANKGERRREKSRTLAQSPSLRVVDVMISIRLVTRSVPWLLRSPLSPSQPGRSAFARLSSTSFPTASDPPSSASSASPTTAQSTPVRPPSSRVPLAAFLRPSPLPPAVIRALTTHLHPKLFTPPSTQSPRHHRCQSGSSGGRRTAQDPLPRAAGGGRDDSAVRGDDGLPDPRPDEDV